MAIGWSVGPRTTFMIPRKLIFGKQLAFNLTKRNIDQKIGNILWFLPNPNFKVFFIVMEARRLVFGMQPDFNPN